MVQHIELEKALNELMRLPDVSGEITMLFEQARNENGGSLNAAQLYQVFVNGVRCLVRKLEPVKDFVYLPEDRTAYDRTLFAMKIGDYAKTPYGTKVERVPGGWLYQMRNSDKVVFLSEHLIRNRNAEPECLQEVVPS